MIKSIGTVAVYVEDPAKALDFWTKKVGFVKKADNDMGNGFRWIEVAPKDAQSALVLYPKKLMPIWNELKASIMLECLDLAKVCQLLKSNGVEITREPQRMTWGSFASFKDEDGNDFLLREQTS